ncbi:hypothetical protein [Sphingosinicella sp. BN140058]|uniref:hypothetical protein n=1 Tax=Sphingosinicella sp. BN140058 TaxID=1892855 RepID=UPI0010116869|nr:hypothetical protein [Sphingosinicella sp. BN140058]QAY78405.1 hypothetical protein ETR14_19085 [Sphingosinicella sp. BN140058]
MAEQPASEWNDETVRTWLQSRIASARADQVAAERGGRERQDECDKAAAEEMVCTHVRDERSTGSQAAFMEALRALLDKDDYIWSGVYNDTRFDRHVRTYIRKLIRMAKTNEGFDNLKRYQ